MTFTDAVEGLRVDANSTLLDACLIRGVPAQADTFDPTTGSATSTPGPVVYDGPCSVTFTSASMTAGSEAYNVIVRVPFDAQIPVGSTVTVSAVHGGGDTGLLNLASMVVVEAPEKSIMILRRLHCQARTLGVTGA